MFNEIEFQNKVFILDQIVKVSNLLDEQYSKELNFRNHCYLRIAYDNTLKNKWDNVIEKPFIKNANEEQLQSALALLKSYISNKKLLIEHNISSLQFRNKK